MRYGVITENAAVDVANLDVNNQVAEYLGIDLANFDVNKGVTVVSKGVLFVGKPATAQAIKSLLMFQSNVREQHNERSTVVIISKPKLNHRVY
jgi:DUF1009 family protein